MVVIDAWSRYFVELVVESSCLLTHNIAPHISAHDLPKNKTMEKYENSQSMEVFSVLSAEIRDSNMAL